MPKDFRGFMQDLLLKVGALPIVVQAKLRAPWSFKVGDRLRAKQDIPVRLFFDWGHSSWADDFIIPEGTIVEYRGESAYSDFSVAIPTDVLARVQSCSLDAKC